MAGSDDIKSRSSELKDQLRSVHGLRGRNLEQAVRRGGRKLPRGIRKDGQQVADALGKMGNPKLERMVNVKSVKAAQSRMKSHLSSVDVADNRRGFWLNLIGTIAFNVLIVASLVAIWVVVTGQI